MNDTTIVGQLAVPVQPTQLEVQVWEEAGRPTHFLIPSLGIGENFGSHSLQTKVGFKAFIFKKYVVVYANGNWTAFQRK